MAVMSTADRAEVHSEFMRTPDPGETFGLTKADLLAAGNAVDQWVSDNAASYNTALPQPARTVLSAAQKSRLLALVLRWRYQKGV